MQSFTVRCADPEYPEEDRLELRLSENTYQIAVDSLKEKKHAKFLKIKWNYENALFYFETGEYQINRLCDDLYEQLQKMNNIEALTLNFEMNQSLQCSQFEKLSEAIQNISSTLIQLDVFIYESNQLSLKGAEALANAIQKCSKLEVLRIKIKENNSIQKEGAILIGNALSQCIQLKELLIYIEGQDHLLGPEGAFGLGNGISKLNQLTKLGIRIWWPNQLGPQGAKGLTCCLPFLTNLQELFIEFGTSNHYQTEGAKHISASLSTCKSLQKLTFVMWDSSYIEGEGFQQLCEAFSSLSNLISLKLLFSGESNFGKSSLIDLSSCLIKLTNIQELFLHINPGYSFQEFLGLQELIQSIGQIKRLLVFQQSIHFTQQQGYKLLSHKFIKKCKRLVIYNK